MGFIAIRDGDVARVVRSRQLQIATFFCFGFDLLRISGMGALRIVGDLGMEYAVLALFAHAQVSCLRRCSLP